MVVDGVIVDERSGRSPRTTNNRMELMALIEGFRFLEPRYPAPLTVYSDSQYCVRTINEWAAGWERKGWTKKTGEIKNLDLVQELYALAQERPGVTLEWIRGHAGWTWNEYADTLARKAAAAS
jgi:ribonuclease HI